MKKLIFISWLMVVSIFSAQTNSYDDEVPSLSQIKTEPINVGYSFKLHSNILDEDRQIMVALPSDYSSGNKSYPVLYAVDAQWNFEMFTQTVGMLANNDVIPKMIYVGIHTGDQRDRDLLPTMNMQSKQGGGADNLLAFIATELIPFIQKNYRTNQFRLLGGSSFGGVFVMHTFLTEPQLFTSYLALSPSMWWDNGVLLKRTQEFLKKNKELKNYLFVAVANEGLGMGVDSLASILKSNTPKGLIWKFEHYPEEIHNTMPYKSAYDGLKFVYKDWQARPVNFETTGNLLNSHDTVTVRINSTSNIIRYTDDGSEPNANSSIYTGAIKITKPIIIKAKPFFGYNISGQSDSIIINYIPKLKAEKDLPELKSGLQYYYYEGDWDMLPDFSKLTPIVSGITTNFQMTEKKRDNLFAVLFKGYIDVPSDDIYKFYLTSDDGSRLLIGNQKVVNNDGLHGDLEKNGKIFLEMGKHNIEIQFFQKGGGYNLVVGYESEKISKQTLPASALYHK